MFNLNVPCVPHLVHIETTYACNQECIFCYNPNRNAYINMDTINAIVDKVHASWIPHVYLIGGEPSLIGVTKLNEYIEKLSERSSVTIVTNGQVYLRGLSTKLACIGVPIHGIDEVHDYHANKVGSFEKAKESVVKYVKEGFDVRCIPVLTKINYSHIADIIGFAASLGMESVFVDRYEDGGVGSKRSDELKLSLEEFNYALEQMIEARDKYGIAVGWGTAIPFCLNKKMLTCDMKADCGAGFTFAAISPNGDVRICNQSEHVYGNLLGKKSFQEIWHNPEIDDFRSLAWSKGMICEECNSLCECVCGCKVDASVDGEYAVDYSIRNNTIRPDFVDAKQLVIKDYPLINKYRSFTVDRYLKLHEFYPEKYLITRYQTVLLDDDALYLCKQIQSGATLEEELYQQNSKRFDKFEINNFITDLGRAGAIHFVGGVSNV